MTIWRRLTCLLPWRRRAAERDMQEELRSIAAMAGPGRARQPRHCAAEDARAEWGWTRLEQAGRDLRYACRSLRKHPGFTVTAVLSLALGIGANTALFTLIDRVTWTLLPVREPEHLLVLGQQTRDGIANGFTYQQYEAVRAGGERAERGRRTRASASTSASTATSSRPRRVSSSPAATSRCWACARSAAGCSARTTTACRWATPSP